MGKNVLSLIETSRGYGRGCLFGVANYVRTHGGWNVLNIERGLTENLPGILKSWRGDGILARNGSASIAAEVARLGVPTVDLRGSFPSEGCATFDTDPEIVAKMAADHFLELGFRRFAFCGYAEIDFSDQRKTEFCAYLASKGYDVIVYPSVVKQRAQLDHLKAEAHGEFEISAIGGWLKGLPKPLAVFACNDIRGRQVTEACSQSGISVPESVAVLGVDDDEVVCELSNPPLSSIRPNTRRIGFESAALLDQLMNGEPPPSGVIQIPPIGVSQRLSSEISAVDDADVANALRYIRSRACEGINVHELVREVAISRSSLERRFREMVGRSPAAEIERIRMNRARLLLTETSYKLDKIARLTGHGSASQFAAAFKRSTGVTPGGYRAQQQSGQVD
jgi:LacI family transcriptional regulator